MKPSLILTALCVAPLLGQDKVGPHNPDYYRTCGVSNGRYWTSQVKPDTANSTYLLAVMDTFYMVGKNDAWPKNATVHEVEKGLDQFYHEPGNTQIPILYALTVVKMRFEGNDDALITAAIKLSRALSSKNCVE
jgi:hypothetical protein